MGLTRFFKILGTPYSWREWKESFSRIVGTGTILFIRHFEEFDHILYVAMYMTRYWSGPAALWIRHTFCLLKNFQNSWGRWMTSYWRWDSLTYPVLWTVAVARVWKGGNNSVATGGQYGAGQMEESSTKVFCSLSKEMARSGPGHRRRTGVRALVSHSWYNSW